MNGYVKHFENNSKCINVLLHDRVLLKKYYEIWDKISNLFQKRI